jgi:hypothetical protein
MTAGDPKRWLYLFDPSECDHALNVFAAWFDEKGVLLVDAGAAKKTLSELLLDSIVEAQREIQVPAEALNRFLAAVYELSWVIGDSPTLPRRVRMALAELKQAWMEFIAYGAGWRIYDELPRAHRKREQKKVQPRKAAALPRARKVNYKAVQAQYQASRRAGNSEEAAFEGACKLYVGKGENKVTRKHLRKIILKKL